MTNELMQLRYEVLDLLLGVNEVMATNVLNEFNERNWIKWMNVQSESNEVKVWNDMKFNKVSVSETESERN